MRIIGGTARGRKLTAPGKRFGNVIRPTSDRAREALFSIIGQRVEDAVVLDLFAGSGAIGLEALSRGARAVTFVDSNRLVAGLIERNLETCGFSERALVICRDLSKNLAFLTTNQPRVRFDLVFLDPPYGRGMAVETLRKLDNTDLCGERCLIIAEDEFRAGLPENVGRFRLVDRRHYGEVGFWFYRPEEDDGR